MRVTPRLRSSCLELDCSFDPLAELNNDSIHGTSLALPMQVLLYSANVFGAAGTARDVDMACVSSFRAKHGQAQDLQHLQQKHIGS